MESAETFVKVLEADFLQPGEGKVVHAGVKKLALFNIDGEFHCIQNFCPHAGGFLGMGEVHGEVVLCPRHAWGFNIKTGACRTDPRYEVRRYETKVEDGWVLVAVPDDGSII